MTGILLMISSYELNRVCTIRTVKTTSSVETSNEHSSLKEHKNIYWYSAVLKQVYWLARSSK